MRRNKNEFYKTFFHKWNNNKHFNIFIKYKDIIQQAYIK